MSPVPRRVALAAALVLAAWAGRAQTTGSIDGRLTDSEGGALPGSVSATSPSLQGTRTTIADRAGLFRLPAVPPGEYTVRAGLPGFRQAEKTATVRLDGTASVDFVLEPLQTEEVVVSGEAPAIDQTSTTTGTSYTSEVITRLPVARNYADIVRSNPGVSTDRGATEGRSLALTIYGATSAENQWIIDGVNTTNVFKGVQGKAINNEFVQEVEVKTGGYQPEYGRALGGVVNVITKSGGNEFHGDGFLYYDSAGTTADKQDRPGDLVLAETRVAEGTRLDYGADLGGFLVKDRLWFFGAFNRVESREELSRVVETAHVSTEDRFPRDTAENLYSGKLTWNAAASTTVVGTIFADPSKSSGAEGAAPVNPEPSTWYSARDQGGTDFGIRLSHLFGSQAIATLQGSYHKDRYALSAPDGIRYQDLTCEGGTPDLPCDPPTHWEPNDVTGGYGYVGALAENSASDRKQFRGDLTLFEGNHEIKVGGDYNHGRTDAHSFFTGGQWVNLSNVFGTPYYEHFFFGVSAEDPTPVPQIFRIAETEDFGAYLQDSWKAASNLTINAGLRWDGENTLDYAGRTVLRLRTAWQPRLGVIWDPWRDGATKVYAFAGRFSYALPTAQAAVLFANFSGLVSYNFDPISVVQDPDAPWELGVWDGGGPFGSPVDSAIVAPYQDELTVGVERSFGSSLTVGLKGTYRRLGGAIETRCDLEPGEETSGSNCAIITPGSDGRFASGDYPTCNGYNEPWDACAEPGTATPPAKRVYRGIELLARQTVGDRLWIQVSYVYSSLRGNYDGGVDQSFLFGVSTPGASDAFDFPALSHNGYGDLFLDRPHRLRLDGYWVTPLRLVVGLQAFAESGAPLNKYGYFNETYGPQVFLVPRGSAGRLPTLWGTNLTFTYPISVGPATVTLQAYLFNVFNRQIATARDEYWSWSQPAGYPDSIFDPNQPQDNVDYGAVLQRSDPRSFRAAVRVSF
jgi:Carboxypeptidase regulatory-like domain/TonB-dependent Receptor Plug Domain